RSFFTYSPAHRHLHSFPTRRSSDLAGYILEWVYRTNDANKDYYVLPVPDVEADPSRFSLDAQSHEAYRTFISDSRALFGKHNVRSEEHTSELQSRENLVCRLLLEKK